MSEYTVLATDPTLAVKWLTQTCIACPSQWDGETDDGRPVYIRYRHGYGHLEVAGSPVLEWCGKDESGGVISEQDLRELFPEVRWPR